MSDQTQTMTTADQRVRQQLRRQMAMQYEVERAMNSLIQNMKKLVDETKIAESRLEKHQIKNLVGVALDTSSVEVIKHYVMYQMGRDGPATSWRHEDFGQKLLDRLEKLRTIEATAILENLPDAGEKQPTYVNEADEIWLLLVRAYLGQLNRYFYYKKEARRWPSTKEE